MKNQILVMVKSNCIEISVWFHRKKKGCLYRISLPRNVYQIHLLDVSPINIELQSYDKSRVSIALILLMIATFAFTFLSLLINDGFAQTLHNNTLYEIVKQKSELYKNPQIDVGVEPSAIGIHERTNKVYVANRGSDTVSVISGDSNTRIKDIPVGHRPVAIEVNQLTDKVYVANSNSANISVISTATDTKIKDISVGDNPSNLAIDWSRNRIYVLNPGSENISIIENDTNIDKDITVGAHPVAIGFVKHYLPEHSKLYVGHLFSNNVSVIDAENYTKIGKDIPIGDFITAIYTDESGPEDLILVASFGSDITIIDGTTDTTIERIPVGKYPMDVEVNRPSLFTFKLFVANSGSNNISIIDESGMVKYVHVGDKPSAIGFNNRTQTLYVANLFSNGVSVIDVVNNTLIASILVNVNPYNAGYIECDKLKAPMNEYVYVWPRAECIAKPNKGFEFQNWQENFNHNSTLIIKTSSASSNTIFNFIANSLDSLVNFFGLKSTLDSLVNFFGLKSTLESIEDFFNIQSEDPESKLKITKFGSFTANFRELPPPIPGEYVATLLGVVATAFVGSWLTPTIIEWRKTKKQGSKLDHYHKEIKNLYNDGKLDSNDIGKLNNLKNSITDEYTKSKINKEQYDKLGEEISVSYREVFNKEIDSLDTHTGNNKVKLLDKINNDISDAYAKGNINELHYNLLKERFSKIRE